MTDTHSAEAVSPTFLSASDAPAGRESAWPLLRYFCYTLVILGVMAGLVHGTATRDDFEQRMFREAGIIEWTQLVLVAGAAALAWVFAWSLVPGRADRPLLAVLGAVIWVAVFRELDSLLPKWIPGMHWTYPVTLCWVLAIGVGWRAGRLFGRGLLRWLRSAGGGICWAGFLCVVVFAQVFGQADLWEGVMGDDYQRAVKTVVEESIELFGYTLVLLGVLESVIWSRAEVAKPSPPDGTQGA